MDISSTIIAANGQGRKEATWELIKAEEKALALLVKWHGGSSPCPDLS